VDDIGLDGKIGISLLPGGASGSNRACCAATKTYSTISSTVLVEMCLCSLPLISADQSFPSV
jgi:hypothetical protein